MPAVQVVPVVDEAAPKPRPFTSRPPAPSALKTDLRLVANGKAPKHKSRIIALGVTAVMLGVGAAVGAAVAFRAKPVAQAPVARAPAPPAPKPALLSCAPSGASKVLAPKAIVGAGIELAQAPSGFAVGFASAARSASVLTLTSGSLAQTATSSADA